MSTQDISVVMITVDRSPRENYLGQTIENLERGGVFTSNRINSFTLVVGDTQLPLPLVSQVINLIDESRSDCPVSSVVADRHLLPCENAGRAILIGSQLASYHPNGWVLFLEDDIDVCADFLGSVGRWLDRHENSRYLLYQFGCPYTPKVYNNHPPLWEYPSPRDFYGTQAIAMRPWAAQALGEILKNNYLSKFEPSEYDLMIGYLAANCEYKIAASVPSFVQHIGTQSSLSDRLTCHTFPSWPGREWSYK